ncbi:MAG: hypothetical protein ABI348_11000 [Nitrososphaera sp.]
MVQPEYYYHLIDAVAYFASSAVPIYFLVKSRNSSGNPLRAVMFIIAGFVLTQGTYHVLGMAGQAVLSKGILEPLSAAIMFSAALAYFFTRRKITKHGRIDPVGQ